MKLYSNSEYHIWKAKRRKVFRVSCLFQSETCCSVHVTPLAANSSRPCDAVTCYIGLPILVNNPLRPLHHSFSSFLKSLAHYPMTSPRYID